MSVVTAETRPLRIAHIRLLQASIAIHMEEMTSEPNLGGGPHLAAIAKDIDAVNRKIRRLAAAEGIDLDGSEL